MYSGSRSKRRWLTLQCGRSGSIGDIKGRSQCFIQVLAVLQTSRALWIWKVNRLRSISVLKLALGIHRGVRCHGRRLFKAKGRQNCRKKSYPRRSCIARYGASHIASPSPSPWGLKGSDGCSDASQDPGIIALLVFPYAGVTFQDALCPRSAPVRWPHGIPVQASLSPTA